MAWIKKERQKFRVGGASRLRVKSIAGQVFVGCFVSYVTNYLSGREKSGDFPKKGDVSGMKRGCVREWLVLLTLSQVIRKFYIVGWL